MKFRRRSTAIPILLLALVAFVPSCSPTRKLQPEELLLDKNVIVDRSGKVEKSEMASYIKQKPNRKVFLWRVYLQIYNSVNQERLARQSAKCDAKIDAKFSRRTDRVNARNARREKKGKPLKKLPVREEIHSYCRFRIGFKQWWQGIGDPPVVYDSTLAKKSARQIQLFLYNKGYFNSTVKDSMGVPRHKKVKSYYLVKEGKPYTIRNIAYDIKDERLNYFVMTNLSGSLIKSGANYDVDVFQQERSRITDILRNEGYYLFSKEYVYFEIDSSLGTHQVDVTLGIKNPVIKVSGLKSALGGDSLQEITHERYYINNIYVHTNYDARLKQVPKDTLQEGDFYLLYTGKLRYTPRLFTYAIFHSRGELYQQKDADLTYKRLTELRMFRSVQIQYLNAGGDRLDCHIFLSSIPKQSFTASTEGMNTSSTLGIAGSLIYDDRNTFKGGEILEIKAKGALEVQKTRTNSNNENIPLSGIGSAIPFNTLEMGGEASMRVPRFLTPFKISGSQSNDAKTNFSATYNYQQRPDYARSIANAAFGYSWKETATKQHLINPVEFNLVNVFIKSEGLDSIIQNSKDLFLKNSYSKHFTLGTRYAFVFNNQDIRKARNFSYFRFGAEGAGNLMRGIFDLIDKKLRPKDSLGYYQDAVINSDGSKTIEKSYTIENIRFSQYLRGDLDYRYYQLLNEKDKLVYRVAFGVGKPLYNLRVLPLEKSFFVGGPNSIRAWQARTLGPGAYADETSAKTADKIGDIKLEGNFEYRFNLVKALNAALFADGGNIWLRKKYSSYPNGEFDASRFVGQIALGAGIGLRFDFNFFIIRLDGALKVRDPSLISYDPALKANDPWVFQHVFQRSWKNEYVSKYGYHYPFTVLNFGIGYPF